jgi:hypothetical protein
MLCVLGLALGVGVIVRKSSLITVSTLLYTFAGDLDQTDADKHFS